MAIKQDNITARYWHDTNPKRKRKDGTYPVKLMIYSEREGRNKAYRTPYHLTPDQYDSILRTTKPRQSNRRYRDMMEAHRLAVLEIAKNVNPFTFALFEKRIGQESRKLTASGITDYLTSELSRQFRPNEVNMASASIVVKCFDDYIDQLRGNDQASTANNYLSALKAFLRFYIDRYGTGTPFHFDHITPDYLRSFQRAWKSGGFSLTSVSMYARALRTIYRRGIKAGYADGSLYPFGKEDYTPPNERRTNIPLHPDEMQRLIEAEPDCPNQRMARDYLILSYWCNGANMADILLWKWKNMQGDTITFKRKKTQLTNEADQKEIIVYLDDDIRAIIDRQGNHLRGAEDYIFPIMNRLHDPKYEGTPMGERMRNLIKNHTRKVNTFIQELAKSIGIESHITTYKARYSFANDLRNNNVPTDIRMELMGHRSEATHRRYLSTIPDIMKREALNQALIKPKKLNG